MVLFKLGTICDCIYANMFTFNVFSFSFQLGTDHCGRGASPAWFVLFSSSTFWGLAYVFMTISLILMFDSTSVVG